MSSPAKTAAFHKFNQAELHFCMSLNQLCKYRLIHRFFKGISIAGNGGIWYGLILLLPWLKGESGLALALSMTVTGLVCTLIYKSLKHILVRERPFILYADIHCGTPPLDRYSFPSGHTLYAVCFNLMLAYHAPVLACIVFPFTLLVAASRIILGLHFPTDVIMGALLGALIGGFSIWILPLATIQSWLY